MGSSVSHETFLSSNKDENDGCFYGAKFENDYFAEGVSRYAFKGTITGTGPRFNQNCVAKVFKKEYAKNFDTWVPDLAASKKAAKFAIKFNSDCLPIVRNYCNGEQIKFIIPLIAKMKEINHFDLLWMFSIGHDTRYVKAQEYISIEPFIPGSYKKFNSNGGYEDGVTSLIHAFCHWTWHISGHKYMISDLQGVEGVRDFILTDPAVHSKDQIFGLTDLGVVGMEMVLANHKCNRICRELNLSNPLTGVNIGGGQRSTTYSFQLTEEQKLRNAKQQSNFFKPMPVIFE